MFDQKNPYMAEGKIGQEPMKFSPRSCAVYATTSSLDVQAKFILDRRGLIGRQICVRCVSPLQPSVQPRVKTTAKGNGQCLRASSTRR